MLIKEENRYNGGVVAANYLLIINISFSKIDVSVSDMYTWIRVSGISMSNGFDICAGEEFLRLISFIFVRLIIQFRDRPLSTVFKLLTVHPIFLYIFVSTILRSHTRFNCFISFHPLRIVLFHTRATMLRFTSRFIYIERLHPVLLISIRVHPPVTFVDAIFIIPFLSIPLILRFTFYHTV